MSARPSTRSFSPDDTVAEPGSTAVTAKMLVVLVRMHHPQRLQVRIGYFQDL